MYMSAQLETKHALWLLSLAFALPLTTNANCNLNHLHELSAAQRQLVSFCLQGESQEEGQKPLDKSEPEGSGQGKVIQQKQPDLATVAEDASADPEDPSTGPPLQRAPSPSASLSSEDVSSAKKSDAAAPAHASAFGARAQRAFSDHSEDLSELGGSSSKGLDKKPSSSSAYSGLNPTSTRSASRMLSDNFRVVGGGGGGFMGYTNP